MGNDPLWVFGYGSLMWNPGFEVAEQVIATLDGYSRTFCMRSIHHRGTSQDPGLVLALDPHDGASCEGLALLVVAGSEAQTLTYLRERELISSAYLEVFLTLTLADGRSVRAVTYVVDTEHVQYCGGLPLEEQAGIIATAVGDRGPNTEYLHNTTSHMETLGIVDDDMAWLSKRVREFG